MAVLKIQLEALLFIFIWGFLGNQIRDKLEGMVGAPYSPASSWSGEEDMEIHSLSKAIPRSI